MRRLERLVAIHDALRRAAPHSISSARLADEFGVARRTIERDLAALRLAGVPLYAKRGRAGGHVSLDQMGNAVVALSPAEVTALLIAVAAAGPDMPFADAANSAVKRLLDALPSSTRVAVEELRGKVRADFEGGRRSKQRMRRTVETAVLRGLVVNIRYRDAADVVSSRAVDAVGLYRGSDGWYLIGWCHLREAGRIFRIDRIVAANLTRRHIDSHDVDETLGWVPREVTNP